jgi:hypothetical protein
MASLHSITPMFLVWIEIICAQHSAKIWAKSLIVLKETIVCIEIAVFGWNFIRSLQRSIRYSRAKHAVQFYLRNRTTAQTEYLMGSTVNNLVKFWVCKLSCLKRHQSNQKGKKWNIAHLSRYKRETTFRWIQIGTSPADRLNWYRVSNEPNYRLSMESNCRPQFGSFELKLLKIGAMIKYINSLSLRDEWSDIFKKTCPIYPVIMGPLLTN